MTDIVEKSQAPSKGWKVLPPFIFRTTGFPYQWLEQLRCPSSGEAADTLLALEHTLSSMRAAFLANTLLPALHEEKKQATRDAAALSMLHRTRKALTDGQALAADLADFWETSKYFNAEWQTFLRQWNACILRLQAASEEGRQIFAREMYAARLALKRCIEDARFAEAVFLSSPAFFATRQRYLSRWRNDEPPGDTSRCRREERVHYAYLQRLCAKNETTSFFGPVNYGSFMPTAPAAIRTQFRPGEQLGLRRIFVAHWAVKALAHEISLNPHITPFLAPRPNPLVRSLGGGSLYVHGLNRSLKVSALQERLFQVLDGQKTIQQIAGEAGLGVDEVIKAIQALAKARLVALDLPLIPTRVDALEELRKEVLRLPAAVQEEALPLIEQAEAHRAALQQASWPARFHAWHAAENWFAAHLPEAVRRGGGTLYADRLVFYEDCQGTLAKLEVGGALYSALTSRFLTVMHLYSVAAALRWLDLQALGRATLKERQRKGESLRYIDMLTSFNQEAPPMPRSEHLADRLRSFLRRHMQAARQQREIHLSREDTLALCEPFHEEVEEVLRRHAILLPSPDIMVAASSAEAVERGDFRLVLGELHDDCSTIFDGFFSYFHPDPHALRTLLHQHIYATPRWKHMTSIISERRSKYITPELPGYSLLLSSISSKEPQWVIPISEVEVREVDGYLTLWARGTELTAYPGDLASGAHRCFSLPCVVPLPWGTILGEEHTPRIVVDDVIVQREAWTLARAQFDLPPVGCTGFSLLVHMRRLQQRYSWPEQIFVKWSVNEKPVLIDMAIPWAVEWLAHLLHRVEQVVVSEMSPAPQELWWEDALGKHTFEMRTAYLYTHPSCAER